MQEIWKDIKNYEGLYQVSNLGNVKSLDKYKYNGKKYYLQKERILKLQEDKYGYKVVTLYKNKEIKNVKVHRLVAQEFIPNPQNKEQINHIDGDKHNNCVKNLEWCNCIENVRHAFENNLVAKRNTTRISQYSKQGAFLKTWDSVAEVVLELKLTKSAGTNIVRCCRHKKPTAYGYIWEYADDLTYRNHIIL